MPTTVRLMPAGDSITYGSHSETSGGYRGALYNGLITRGWVPEFVGSQTTPTDITPSGAHEGYAGERIDQLAAHLAQTLPVYRPDAILLVAGTNDASNGDTAATMLSRMAAYLAKAREARAEAWVCVSTVPLRLDNGAWNAEIEAVNAGLGEAVADHVSLGGRAVLMDVGGRLVAADLDTDGIHPRPYGYTVLASYWLGELLPFLEARF